VFESETLTLQDDTEVEIKPLNIKSLRKFMEVVDKLSDLKKESDAIDVLLEAAAVAIARTNPELAADTDKLEEILDVPTMHKIIEIAGGVKLNDPNLTAAYPGTI
jgi:hypothetical protein